MNTKSVLCRFLAEHPQDWEARLTQHYAIKVKHDGDYAIFNYGYDCDFSDAVVQEARGIILDCRSLEVVCWPFRKFGNYNESYADSIDWSTARVLEKVDGSIIKLWFDGARQAWQFSTNATIRAEEASIENCIGLTFADVLKRADNYGDIPYDRLDKQCTYLFELVSPETQVVVRYNTPSLYHLGTRNNRTGVESEVDIGIKKPASYPLDSLDACCEAAIRLNERVPAAHLDTVQREGFVVVDAHYHRVKVKSPDYLMLHRLKEMSRMGKRDCVSMLLQKDARMELLCEANPNLVPVFKFYDFQLSQLCYVADQIATLARQMHREYSGERGAVARILVKHRLSFVGFRALECDACGRDILLGCSLEKLCKLMPDYAAEDLSILFAPSSENAKKCK